MNWQHCARCNNPSFEIHETTGLCRGCFYSPPPQPIDPIATRAAGADVFTAFPFPHVLDARDAMQGALEALEQRLESLQVTDRTLSMTASIAYVSAKIDRLKLSLARFNERIAAALPTLPARSE